jgi:hypothetical protein
MNFPLTITFWQLIYSFPLSLRPLYHLTYSDGIKFLCPLLIIHHHPNMAKVKDNIVTEGLSGILGKLLVFRQKAGKTIVSVKPTFTQPQSEAQRKQVSRFAQATQYAKHALQDPATKAAYAARAKAGQHAHNVAIADFLHAPSIGEARLIREQQNQLSIEASDDFKVTSVWVKLCHAEGMILEEGEALRADQEDHWSYTIQKEYENLSQYHLQIRAYDLPGNCSEKHILIG